MLTPEEIAIMVERLEKAAVEYERAPASRAAAARQEKTAARKALYEALAATK